MSLSVVGVALVHQRLEVLVLPYGCNLAMGQHKTSIYIGLKSHLHSCENECHVLPDWHPIVHPEGKPGHWVFFSPSLPDALGCMTGHHQTPGPGAIYFHKLILWVVEHDPHDPALIHDVDVGSSHASKGSGEVEARNDIKVVRSQTTDRVRREYQIRV